MKDLVNFFHEIGMLNRIKRSGPLLTACTGQESVAEHSYRTMLIGYILAKLEKVDADKVLKMMLIHDLPESRILDLNKISHRYLNFDDAEKKAFEEQLSLLPEDVAKEWNASYAELNALKTNEAVIAKEADYIECAIEAKELVEKGFSGMQDWVDNVDKFVKTKSAKAIMTVLKNSNSNDWWHGLKKLPKPL